MADRPLVQKIYYDTWFTEYFKMQSGRYIDNMQSPTNLSNHGEIWDAGGETLDQWASESKGPPEGLQMASSTLP